MKDVEKFENMGLPEEMLVAIRKMGFEEPTEIQKKAIPPIREGRSIIGQARTGTGKTAAFGIPIVEKKIRNHHKGHRINTMIITPTRELAVQVSSELEDIGRGSGIRCHPFYGGQPIDKQIKELNKGMDVVVGTPGRLMDHMRRGTMDLRKLNMFVLDEADRMLDMGFIEDIRWIMQNIPKNIQIALFSATLPPPIKELAKEHMADALEIYVSHDDLTVPEIDQVYYSVGRVNKIWALTQVLALEKPSKVLVFCATKYMTDKVTRQLIDHGFPSAPLHGDISQSKREKTLDSFRRGKVVCLVATDVAARGLDIDDISHVINYDIPGEATTYVHRIGRTARAGKTGKAISFVTAKEKGLLQSVEFLIKKEIKKEDVPEAHGKKGKREKGGLRRLIDFDEICNPFGMVDFVMDMGSKDGLTIHDVMSIISRTGRINETLVGDIRIRDTDTVVQIHKSSALTAKNRLSNFRHKNIRGTLRLVKGD